MRDTLVSHLYNDITPARYYLAESFIPIQYERYERGPTALRHTLYMYGVMNKEEGLKSIPPVLYCWHYSQYLTLFISTYVLFVHVKMSSNIY